MLQKKSTGVEPHYLDVWLLVHDDDEASAEKLVSNNIKCYAIFVIYPYVLTQYSARIIYTSVEENPQGDLEVPWSVPFIPDVAYVAGGGTPHGRYVKISIVFR
jgi:hypothetical protein